MYLLSSITAVSPIVVEKSLFPPNSIIQLVVGVTLHTEREWQYLLVTFSGRLIYKNKMIIIKLSKGYADDM